MPKKRKVPGRGNKRRALAPRTRPRQHPAMREIPLGQGLQAFAAEGGRSILGVIVAASVIVAIAALVLGLWALRPIPEYTSENVEAGSPFGVAFRLQNTSAWFPLSHPKISCIVTIAGEPGFPAVAASDVRFPSDGELKPGESATFKCPLQSAFQGAIHDETGAALRSELFFRTTYDLPLHDSWRLTDRRGPFVLNTHLLPPRWTEKP